MERQALGARSLLQRLQAESREREADSAGLMADALGDALGKAHWRVAQPAPDLIRGRSRDLPSFSRLPWAVPGWQAGTRSV